MTTPEPILYRKYTPLTLLPFDGHPPHNRVFLALNRKVFDVTKGANFYGPGGAYSNFAGRDASRGLAKGSFDEDMLVDPKEAIDTLEDLTE